MAYRISLTERNAGVNGITGLFNSGSDILIYSNATSPPASTPETALPGGSVLLARVPFSSTPFITATTGTGVATGLPLQTTILNSGTAAWFKFVNGSDVALGDGVITTVAVGTGDMLFDNTTFVSGGIVSITDLSISIPM
jgi:hypothetical protein